MSLKAARIAAKKVVASVDLERDPHAEKLAARRALAEAKKRAVLEQRTTVEALAETCVAVLPLRPKTVKEWTRLVRTEIIPAFGDRQASELTRVEIRSWADGIAKRPAPHTANRAFEVLRRVYSWSVENDRLPATPFVALKRPAQEELPTGSFPPRRSGLCFSPSTRWTTTRGGAFTSKRARSGGRTRMLSACFCSRESAGTWYSECGARSWRISAVGSPAGRSQAASQGVASLDARTSSRSLPRPWL